MKIALLGYGKMGKTIEQLAIARKHEIVLKIDESNSETLSNEALKTVDVAIEFSTPQSVLKNIYKCFEASIPIVVGTTGWYADFENVVNKCNAKQQSLFHATNFSIGVNIFFKVNEYLAQLMNKYDAYDVSIEEIHHIHKLDSPSGTGITTAEQILKNIHRKDKWVEGETTSNPNELLINSVREGETPGTHIVKYTSAIDAIELKHIAHNRTGFALGAVLAAEWIRGKKGVFTMSDLMNNSI
ncbi:MAG: 4-hydroxy-tetrahydrodipicolinate reductase [Bacteroidetes bacterium]|nr:4-hydroxy-tetrahydrodipicolinate reductase [Bacteroidota bacterium]